MKSASWVLIALGAAMTATVLAPVRYIEAGRLPTLTSTYVWMMIVPALAAGAVLLYQWRRSIDRPSAIAAVLIGVVIATYPFWGHSFDEGMRMRLDWIGTILAHYVAGALVALAGVLQLLEPRTIPAPAPGGASSS